MSTTFADARMMGVPTIEYTEYRDDLLKVMNGGSFWPEWVTYFIQADENLFRDRIVKVLAKDKNSWPRPSFKKRPNTRDLIEALIN